MTNTLETLKKLSKQKLDELRNNMNVYLTKRDELVAKNQALETQLEKEKQAIRKNPASGLTFATYLSHVRNEQENNQRFIKKLNQEIDKFQAQIQDAFSEMKQYEILQERLAREAESEKKREESVTLDEIASRRFDREDVTY